MRRSRIYLRITAWARRRLCLHALRDHELAGMLDGAISGSALHHMWHNLLRHEPICLVVCCLGLCISVVIAPRVRADR